MDPVLGKYINLIQLDSDRATWTEFMDKIKKLGYKQGVDYTANGTGNPSAYFKAEVANNAKVKKLRDKYNVSSFGIEESVKIDGEVKIGSQIFLKEEKEIATIVSNETNEFGYQVIKENGQVIRRGIHEFILITEKVDIDKLKYNPYAVCHTTVDKDADPDKYDRCVNHVVDAQTESLDEKIDSFLSETSLNEFLNTRDAQVQFLMNYGSIIGRNFDKNKLNKLGDSEVERLFNKVSNDERVQYMLSEEETATSPFYQLVKFTANMDSWVEDDTKTIHINDWKIQLNDDGQTFCVENGDGTIDLAAPLKKVIWLLSDKDELDEHHLFTREDKIAFILSNTKNHPSGGFDANYLNSLDDQSLDSVYNNVENNMHLSEYKDKDVKFVPVKGSQVIRAVAYDPEMQILYIKFNYGAYEYYDVPEEVYEEFLKAPSMGKYFHANIRNVYTYALSKKYNKPGRKANLKESDYAAAEDYVEYLLGGDWEELFNKVGLSIPSDIDATEFIPAMEKAHALGVEYFMSHPEEIDYAVVESVPHAPKDSNPPQSSEPGGSNVTTIGWGVNDVNDDDLNELQNSTPYFNKNVEKLAFEGADENRYAKEEFIAKNCYALDSSDELADCTEEEALDKLSLLPSEEIDYLYNKLKTDNSVDLDDRMNENPKQTDPNVIPPNPEDYTKQPGYIHENPFGEDEEPAEPEIGDEPSDEELPEPLAGVGDDSEEEPEVGSDIDIPEIIDFRGAEDGLTFTPDTTEYKALKAVHDDEQLWSDYTAEMTKAGVDVDYDDVTDAFKVTWGQSENSSEPEFDLDKDSDDSSEESGSNDQGNEENGEEDAEQSGFAKDEEDDLNEYLAENKKLKAKKRYVVDPSSIKAVKDIVESKNYKFVVFRGSLVESKKEDVYELIVEKHGHKAAITYNDTVLEDGVANSNLKRWTWNKSEFKHLQECLDAVYIPFKKLVNETAQTEIDKEVIEKVKLDEKHNKYAYKTDKLPIEEQERRLQRGQEIIDKLMDPKSYRRGFDYGRE